MVDSHPWRPVLDGSDAQRALDMVAQIGAEIAAWKPSDPSLANGGAGGALALAYIATLVPQLHSEKRRESPRACHRCCDRGPEHQISSEAPWALLGCSNTSRTLRSDFRIRPQSMIWTQTLVELLFDSDWDAPLDLVAGTTGIGVYGLERGGHGQGGQIVAGAVRRLGIAARHVDGGVAWLGDDHARGGSDQYDVGIAHGVPGHVAFLAAAHRRAMDSTAVDLLRGATRWVLSQESALGYPYHSGGPPQRERTRVAWCYGDPGVATALERAARALEAPEISQRAVANAVSAGSSTLEESQVQDPWLCHGAAGVGLMLHRLSCTTAGDDRLAESARTWYLPRARDAPNEALYQPLGLGFLEGMAGLALALHAASTNVEPAWDSVLLLSEPAQT